MRTVNVQVLAVGFLGNVYMYIRILDLSSSFSKHVTLFLCFAIRNMERKKQDFDKLIN